MSLSTILVVDDSDLIHRMYDLVLMRYARTGTEVIHAKNGKEALEKLQDRPNTNLILLDINMPVMSGLEFLKIVKGNKELQSIPVILVSTEGAEEDTLRGLEAGAAAYVTKPFLPEDLRKIIQKVVG